MTTPKTHRFTWLLGRAACYLIMTLVTAWAALAIYFDLPSSWFSLAAALLYTAAVLAMIFSFNRLRPRLLLCGAGCVLVLLWWLTLKPSNQGPWQADVSRTAWAEVNGDEVDIHHFRECRYRAELDYNCEWLERKVQLSQIRGIDLFMSYWGSPWIAHTIVSFDTGNGDPIAFSIEARKRPGQNYSSVRGFFRQYTLIAVVSDERDLVRLRTNYRHGESVYLYRTTATPAFARALFLNYLGLANRLHAHPQWYNAVTHNCTTEIFSFETMKRQPFNWRFLLNGKADEMEYNYGYLAGGLPFKELKQRAYINPAAQAADGSPDFSARIREGRPGFFATHK